MMVKNISKTIFMLVLIWLILPSGPADIFIIPFIINKIGMRGYIVLSIVLVLWLYKTVEGKTLTDKINTIKKEIKKVM